MKNFEQIKKLRKNAKAIKDLFNDLIPKWQAERMYSEEDIYEYATFCIECDRVQLPILDIKSWFEQFKKK